MVSIIGKHNLAISISQKPLFLIICSTKIWSNHRHTTLTMLKSITWPFPERSRSNKADTTPNAESNPPPT